MHVLYGLKLGTGRVPYGGQEDGRVYGNVGWQVQAVAGPISRSMQDLEVFLGQVVPWAKLWGADGVPGSWKN